MGDDLREDLSALTSQQITQRYKKVNEAIEDIREVTLVRLDVIRWGNKQMSKLLPAMASRYRVRVPVYKPMHDYIMFLKGVDIAQTKKFGRFFELVREYTNSGKLLKDKELLTPIFSPISHKDNPLALLSLSHIYMRGRSVEKDEKKAEAYLVTMKDVLFRQLQCAQRAFMLGVMLQPVGFQANFPR
jgi:hypothetical protein